MSDPSPAPEAAGGGGALRDLVTGDDRRARLVRLAGLGAVFLLVIQLLWPAPPGVVLQGIIVGSLTALVAFGIALVYGSNRIINFAQADLGAVPAVLMVTLVTSRGWPFAVALPVALGAAVLSGVVVERLVIRPFAKAPRLILMVATIGLAQILAGVATALPFKLGNERLSERLPAPFDISFEIDPIIFRGSDVLALVAVPLTIALLVTFLRRTPYGTAIRASAESTERATLLGIPVERTQVIVWVVVSLLAAVAMLLRAGVLGLPLGSAFGPAMLLRALAAAVIGRMDNYPRMFAAACAIGVVETAIIWNENSAVLIDPAIFVILVGFLLLQRADRESRVADQALSAWRSAAAVKQLPDELAALPAVRTARLAIGAAIAVVLVGLPFVMGDGRTNLAGALFVFCLVALSLVVLTGWGGEISLGHMAFVAIGAATAAVLNVHLRWDLSITLLAAGTVGAIAALLIGLPALRVRGLFLAVTTLAFALVTSSVLLDRRYLPFLPDDTTERIVRFPLFSRTDVSSERAFYYVCLAVLVIGVWITGNLRRTRLRRVLVAARDNERAAQAFAVDVTRVRLTAFATSGFLAAMAGGLFAVHQQALGQQVFEPAQSVRALTMVVVGGLGSIPGALLGAVFLKSTEWFNTFFPQEYRFFVSFAGTGVGLLLILRFLPGGLAEPLYRARDRFVRHAARQAELVVPGWTDEVDALPPRPRRSLADTVEGALPRRLRRRSVEAAPASAGGLSVHGLDVHYGQVQVLFDVSLEIPDGEIVALLGTNGAGKSTLLRAVCGLTPATSGTIWAAGADVTGRPPHEMAGRGIVQVPGGKGVFPSLTVRENLELATWPIRSDRGAASAAVEEVLGIFPVLRERLDSPAATLSGGQQQMLTLGMAFIARPALLMIDELSLGLAPTVVEQLLEVVRRINATGTTVVLVEQSVNIALTVARTAHFMEKGEIRFSGPTAELLQRPDILRAVYLQGAGNGRATVPATPRAASTPAIGDEVVLDLRDLHKSFGGRTVIDGVSLQLHRNEILGIIGPNGAGKTTLFDLVSGFLRADSGEVVVGPTPLQGLRPDQRARLGLARSFQDARLFADLTVREAIQVALDQRLDTRDPIAAALALPLLLAAEREVAVKADELIDLFGVGVFRNNMISELSTGSRRIVDIACQFALSPEVVLLDEPSSGIAQREAEALAPVLLRLRDELGASLLVIEHDMPLLTSVADRLLALDLGRVVCDGPADDVLTHPQVVASYLGGDAAVIGRSGDGGPRRRRRGREQLVAR